MNKTYLTLEQAANYISISYRTAQEDWPEWGRFGVNPTRYMGKPRGRLLFKAAELDEMMNQTTVMKG